MSQPIKTKILQQLLADAVVPVLTPHSEAILAAQAQFMQFAQTFAVMMNAARLTFKPFLDESLPFLKKLAETDLTGVLDAHEKSFLHMADCGWTLPDWIDLGELNTLHLKSSEEIDCYIVNGFMANDGENLKDLSKTLKGISRFSQWHPLIEDIIASILAGNHCVAIPATLTIMDGYLANAVVKAFGTTPKITSPFKVLQNAKWHEDDTFDAVFWKSGVVFLSRVFASSDFTQQPPTFINRHWVLHGRAPVDWTLSDALRLVNSLTTLDFLFVTVGQPKPNAPKWQALPIAADRSLQANH